MILPNFNLKSERMADIVYPANFPRYQETFPALTDAEIGRLRRYGVLRKYSDGEKLFEAGRINPGMFVVLKGSVALSQRDGLGHTTPIAEQGVGQFLADVGQLSTRAALVDGTAEGDVETLLIPPETEALLLVEVQGDGTGEVRHRLNQIVQRTRNDLRLALGARRKPGWRSKRGSKRRAACPTSWSV